jgi:AcrR family transcriptional regulator
MPDPKQYRDDMDEPSPTISYFNKTDVLRHFGGRENLFAQMVEIFFTQLPILLAKLEDSLVSRDLKALRRYAHTLKGSIAHFTRQQPYILAQVLETMAQPSIDWDLAAARKTELAKLLERLVQEIKAQLP